MKNKIYIAVSAAFALAFSAGCAMSEQNETAFSPKIDSYMAKKKAGLNTDINKAMKHLESFDVKKGDSAEYIFALLGNLTKKTYIVGGATFTTDISVSGLSTLKDVLDLAKVQNYILKTEDIGERYVKVTVTKTEPMSKKTLSKKSAEIRGNIPIGLLLSKVFGSDVKYEIKDNAAAEMMQNIYAFDYKGNAADGMDHIASKAGLSVDYFDDRAEISFLQTAFFTIDLPLQDKTLLTGISNAIGGSGTTAGQTSSVSASSTSSGSASSATASLFAKYESKLVEELKHSINTGVGPLGKFSYIQSTGQITVKDRKENLDSVRRIVNTFNDKFKEKVEIEFTFYKIDASKSFSRGLDLANLINNRITLAASSMVGTAFAAQGANFALGWKEGDKFSAIFQILNEFGNAEIINSFSVSNQNNIANTTKIAKNKGYLSGIQNNIIGIQNSSVSQSSTTSTTSSVPDGSFLYTLARTMDGNRISVAYFTNISEFESFLTNSVGGNTIQSPNTAEQSYDNVQVVQSGVPYAITSFKHQSKNGNKISIPGIENLPILDSVIGSKKDSNSETYIVVMLKATKKL